MGVAIVIEEGEVVESSEQTDLGGTVGVDIGVLVKIVVAEAYAQHNAEIEPHGCCGDVMGVGGDKGVDIDVAPGTHGLVGWQLLQIEEATDEVGRLVVGASNVALVGIIWVSAHIVAAGHDVAVAESVEAVGVGAD